VSSLINFGLVIDTFWSGFWGALVLAIISFLIGLLFRPLLARSNSRR
jgi:putative membrane protein